MYSKAEDQVAKIEFLARSRSRMRIVEELYANERLDKAALRDRLDGSRTTVQRNLDALEEQGWIRNSNSEYQITWSGRLIAEQFRDLIQMVGVVDRIEPLLQCVPPDEFDLDVHHLADADCIVPQPGNPLAINQHYVKRLKTAESYRLLLPVTGLHAHETAHEVILENGAEGELVITNQIADIFQNDPDFAKLTDEMIATGRLDVFVSPESIPFFIGIFDGELTQIGGLRRGQLHIMLESESSKVTEWADQKFKTYKNDARSFAHR